MNTQYFTTNPHHISNKTKITEDKHMEEDYPVFHPAFCIDDLIDEE